MSLPKTYIHSYNCITPLGFDIENTWNKLIQNRSGLTENSSYDTVTGIIDNEVLETNFRNNFPGKTPLTRLEKMIFLALLPLTKKHSVTKKSLLILSTTKGNISALQNHHTLPEEVFLHTSAKKIAQHFGFGTTPIVVSNACVSGVMAVIVAKRLLQSGTYDNAFVIAADEVTSFVLSGFQSFQALSKNLCKPFSSARDGINIGEAAAAVYIDTQATPESFEILGEGSVNDANHISGPSRTGEGLFESILRCVKEAGIRPDDIDYISAHGTATLYNDEMESIAFHRAGLQQVPVNSLKGYFGHTLGTSGLLELIVGLESARNNTLIASMGSEDVGVSQAVNLIFENKKQNVNIVLKTASGFGGSNAAVLIKKLSGYEN